MLRAHGVVVGTLIVLTCGDPVAPRPEPYLSLLLSSRSAGPGQVLRIEAILANPGAPIHFSAGCGDEDGIWFEVVDPRGRQVFVAPQAASPSCLSRAAALATGERLVSFLLFDGNLYERDGDWHEAVPGSYLVIARFRYGPTPPDTESIVLEQRASFLWRERTAP